MQIQWWHFDIEKITGNIDAIVRGDIEPLRKLKGNEKWMTNSIIPRILLMIIEQGGVILWHKTFYVK